MGDNAANNNSAAVDIRPGQAHHAAEGGGGSSRWMVSNNGNCIALTKDPTVIALAVASLVFLLFTVIMAIDQWEAITTGQGMFNVELL